MSQVEYHLADNNRGISLTEKAQRHLREQLARRGNGVGIRLKVEKAGCSGLMYVLDYVDKVNPDDQVFTIAEDLTFYVDAKSYAFVAGTELDYVEEGLNKRFTFTNPNQKGTCGCGESFTVE